MPKSEYRAAAPNTAPPVNCNCKKGMCHTCRGSCRRCDCTCANSSHRGPPIVMGRVPAPATTDTTSKPCPRPKPRPKKIQTLTTTAAVSSAGTASIDAGHQFQPRKSRTVLVPVAAEGTEAYTLSCITDVLSRFGAKVVLAKVDCVLKEDTAAALDGDDAAASVSASSCSMWELEHGRSSHTRSSPSSPTRRLHHPEAASPGKEEDLTCTTNGGVKIVADMTIKAAAALGDWDMIVLPGGMPGCKQCRSSETVMSLLKRQRSFLRFYGAIGEAPAIVLATGGLLGLANGGKAATCFPDPLLRDELPGAVDDGVVVQGNLITASGPGAALSFALRLGEQLYGKAKAGEIAKELLAIRGGKKPSSSKVARNDTIESIPRKRRRLSQSKRGTYSSLLCEETVFVEIVWPVIDLMGWTIEKKACGKGTVYCQPGVKRDSYGFAVLDAGDDNEGNPCFETTQEIVNFIRHQMRSNSAAQKAVKLYTSCLDRVDDLVEMGRLSLGSVTLESVLTEIRMNPRVLEVPLFEEIIWPQLLHLGWASEEETRIRPRSYAPPHVPPDVCSAKGSDRFKEPEDLLSRQQVIDFLRKDDVWGSKDEVLQVLDVYQACISVGNDLDAQGVLIDECTPMWLYLKAREKRRALPRVAHLLGPDQLGPDQKKLPTEEVEVQHRRASVPDLIVASESAAEAPKAEPKDMDIDATPSVTTTDAPVTGTIDMVVDSIGKEEDEPALSDTAGDSEIDVGSPEGKLSEVKICEEKGESVFDDAPAESAVSYQNGNDVLDNNPIIGSV